MSVHVVTVSSRPIRGDEPYYRPDAFYASLLQFGVEPTTLGYNDPSWGGLMSKPRLVRDWLRDGECKAETLIFADAWDLVFLTHPDEVEALWSAQYPARDTVVFNAERNCFPRADLADKFADHGTPFRYLNSGFIIGATEVVLAMLESMQLEDIAFDHRDASGRWWHPNDQAWFQVTYLLQTVPMALDSRRTLCAAMAGDELADWSESASRPVYCPLDAAPPVLHFNGGAKNDAMPVFLQRLGLS